MTIPPAPASVPGMSKISVDKLFDNIRGDPRWLPFLRSVGKSPEQLAKITFSVALPEEPPPADSRTARSGGRGNETMTRLLFGNR